MNTIQPVLRPAIMALMLASASAQATWTRQSPLPYPPQLNADEIAFSGSRGYIVGANNLLQETTDGGTTWHERVLSGPLYNEGLYGGVTFFGPTNGWIVGQKVSWSNACFRTVDAGATWTQMASIPDSDWAHVDFVSATHGWVGAPWVLYVTHDAGVSWSAQNFGVLDRIDSMNFFDDNVGLLSAAGAIRRTQDGGQSWTVVHNHDAFAIEWLDAQTVIASTQSFGGPDFARSTDAGLTWQTIQVPGVVLQEPVRIDATTVMSGTPDGDLYRSTDAGLTWQPAWSGGTGGTINGGSFTSPTEGFILESGNLILRTHDAGQSWAYASSGFGMEFEDVKMFDDQRGLVVGGGGTVMRTVDGGNSWTPTRPGWTLSNHSPLMDLSLVAPSFAFAAGDNGTLVKTLDGGITWQGVAAPTGYPNGGTGDYWACSFVSPTEGWMAGEYLEITHTTDGGATWQQQFVGGSSADGAYDMDFVDALHGWIVGTFDGVFATVDGGASWNFHAFPSPGPFARAVDFVNPLVGWAAGRDGWVARSTDGGLTWTQQNVPGVVPGTTNLFSIQALSVNECWAASTDNGRVFHTTNAGNTWTELTTTFHDAYDGYTGIAVTPNGDVWVAGYRGAVSRFGAPNLPFPTFCFGDGTGTQCPCGNDSATGSEAGCQSSIGSGGRLTATGHAALSADTLALHGSQMPNSSALYFQGTTQSAGGAGTVFGDGLRCASGSIVRLGAKVNALGVSGYPGVGEPTVSAKGAITAPGVRTYQVWFRNAAAYCTPSTFNLTNGVEITWGI